MVNTESVSQGLEDVDIKWTRLTSIDGERGILRYGGYSIEDIIASNSMAEEIQYLFLYGKLPNAEELKGFRERIEEGYNLPDYVVNSIINLPRTSDAVAMQMAAFASMAAAEKDFKWNKETDRNVAARIIGRMAAITAVIHRHINGEETLLPEHSKSYARSFLKAAFGKDPTPAQEDAMNTAIILYLDHEVPASTTAGLVTVSTLSDLYSGITAALSALKGPLHGGAAEAAIAQFSEIGSVDKVDSWFHKHVIEEKSRLMGFGHRVYRTYDPRAKIFKSRSEELIKSNREAKKLYDIATRLEELGLKQFSSKRIFPNTDYYSGLVYLSLGFQLKNDIYTGLFALSRVTGWQAHFIEYVEEEQRLIRPRAVYTGPEPRAYVPLSQRK
ncbi:MAG: citrate synthase [Candidatus Thermoplasmatota archaeon]|nr:citrate synthase [Candidatus Thermoplasmatota archaeon]